MSKNIYDNTNAGNHDNNDPQSQPHIFSNIHPRNKPDLEEGSINQTGNKQPPIQLIGDEELNDSFMGLPIGWRQRDIPTGKQIFEATLQAFERTKKYLSDDQTILSKSKLEAHTDIIIQASEFAILLPEVVDCALKLKDKFFGAACLHLWNRLLMNLFFKATNYETEKGTRDKMLAQIAFELGIVSNVQSNHTSAVARLKQAIDYALNNADDKHWLQAHVEHFYATCLQIPLEEIQLRANNLLAIAKTHQDQIAEMRIYMILAHAYNLYGDCRQGFINAQQALIMAAQCGNSSSTLFSLAMMTPLVFELSHLQHYLDQILAYWAQTMEGVKDLRLYAIYLGQLSPYLYSQREYALAREYYLKSIVLFEMMMDKENLTRMLHGLGMTCTQLGQWDEAQNSFDQALKLYQELKQVANQVWIQHCIAWLNIKCNNLEKGVDLLEQAYKAAQNLPLNIQRRETLISSIKKDLDDARPQLTTIL